MLGPLIGTLTTQTYHKTLYMDYDSKNLVLIRLVKKVPIKKKHYRQFLLARKKCYPIANGDT